VRRLNPDSVAWVEDDAVGGDQSCANGRAQGDQREDAGVKEHEVLDGEIDDMADAGQRQERDDHDDGADGDAPDLGHVLGDYTARVRASGLTATGTTASRSHGYLLVYFRTQSVFM
jgi:hypothetical protein